MANAAMGQASAQKAVDRCAEAREINRQWCQQADNPSGPACAPLDQSDKTGQAHGQCRAQHPVGKHDTVFAGRHRTGMCPAEKPGCDPAQCSGPDQEADCLEIAAGKAGMRQDLGQRRRHEQGDGEMNRNTVQNAQARHGPFERRLWPVLAPVGMSGIHAARESAVIVCVFMEWPRRVIRGGMVMIRPVVSRLLRLRSGVDRLFPHGFGRVFRRRMRLHRWGESREDQKETGDKP